MGSKQLSNIYAGDSRLLVFRKVQFGVVTQRLRISLFNQAEHVSI